MLDGHTNKGRIGVVGVLGEFKHRDPSIADQLIAQQKKHAGTWSERMGGRLAHGNTHCTDVKLASPPSGTALAGLGMSLGDQEQPSREPREWRRRQASLMGFVRHIFLGILVPVPPSQPASVREPQVKEGRNH